MESSDGFTLSIRFRKVAAFRFIIIVGDLSCELYKKYQYIVPLLM